MDFPKTTRRKSAKAVALPSDVTTAPAVPVSSSAAGGDTGGDAGAQSSSVGRAGKVGKAAKARESVAAPAAGTVVRRRRSTIIDVAREAGVDSSTVSLALRKDPRIRVETRERIEDAARRIGYMPNRIARSLSGGTTKVIGVMLTEMNRFFAGPLESLQNVGEHAGYTISVHFSWWDRLREQQGMRQFCENCVEGVIWAPNAFDTSLRDTAEILRQANIPAVMLGLVHDDPQCTVPCHQIGIDMKAALSMGLEYLVKLGHRHIAVASAAGMSGRRGDMFRLRQRILGELFAQMGLEPLEKNLYLTADHEYGGIEIAMKLMGLERRQWPTAIFVAEDSLARGLARSLQALGVNVPGDINLLGYDVSSGEYADPVALSTVSLESKEIASEAMALLLDLITKKIPAQPYRTITSPAIIVQRDSCAAPASRSGGAGSRRKK